MTSKRYEPHLLVLAFFACLVAVAACFLPKWFLYSADWAPCKSTSKESPFPSHTQEQLPLFGVGPETFSQQLEGIDDTGCYVTGMCNPSEVLHRLYQADFTETQRITIHAMRLAGILGVAVSIYCLVLVGLRCRSYLRSWRSQKPVAFALGFIALFFIGGLVLLLCIAQSVMPSAAALLGGEEHPVDCQTSPPQAIECGYPRTSSDGELYVAHETLKSGTSIWKFERVLFLGPAWTGFSFVLVAIVCRLCRLSLPSKIKAS
jgi:hypothetical protein